MIPSSKLPNFNIDLTQPANIQALNLQAAYIMNAMTPIPGLPNPTIQPAQVQLLSTFLNFYGQAQLPGNNLYAQHVPNAHLAGLPAHLGTGVLPTPQNVLTNPNAGQGLPMTTTGIAAQPPTNNSFSGTAPLKFLTTGINGNAQNFGVQPFAIDQAAINRAAQQILNNSFNMQQIIATQQLPIEIPQNVAVPNQNLNWNWHPSPPSSEDDAQKNVVGFTIKKEVDCFSQGNGSNRSPPFWSSSDIKTELQKVEVKFKPKARPRTIALCSLGPNLCSAPFYKYSRPLKLTNCPKCWSSLHTFCFNNTNRATNEQVICCDGRMNYRAAEFFESHRENFFQIKKRKM